eukprot:TRINITY_DN4566_c0_g1_i1.p1 TRINITY_DN4566_c0_g1~~TRINITY_DN4566_c0_g1_i1.p1  ORF type:complete len:249 (+),score=45.03 TRINITY_DN4566_c0_g1_i1:103-747(+)
MQPQMGLEYDRMFMVDYWYPYIASETFNTSFITLNSDEAKAMYDYRENQLKSLEKRDKTKGTLFWDLDGFFDEMTTEQYPFNIKYLNKQAQDTQISLLKSIETALDSAIKPYLKSGGAFIRLSTRSPKDAVLKTKYIRTLIVEELENYPRTPSQSLESQELSDLYAFTSALSKSWKVTSGAQALSLLLNSQRVYKDLGQLLSYLNSEQSSKLGV